jgi:Ca-activated chloride channel family protein
MQSTHLATKSCLLRFLVGLPSCLLFLSLALFPALALAPTVEAKEKSERKILKEALEQLPEKFRRWLGGVDVIITKEERATFLKLEKDYQRDAFIERFWKVRDPYPGSARNEFREDFNTRMEEAAAIFGRTDDDRTRVLLVNGPPLARLVVSCKPSLVPMEVWHYRGSDNFGMEFLLLFFQGWKNGPYRLWDSAFGLADLRESGVGSLESSFGNVGGFFGDCGEDADAVQAAVNFVNRQGGQLGAFSFFQRLLKPRIQPPAEWVATFDTYSTDIPEDAITFEAVVELDYPGRHQSRSILQVNVGVPVAGLTAAELATHTSYNLMLNGEVLREGKLFDSFRYKYDFPKEEVQSDTLPLIFQRYLRAGEYRLIVKVEDINSGRFHRTERPLNVPQLQFEPPPEPQDPETARLLAEANAAIRSGENTIQIAPLSGKWQTGLVRIDALTTGADISKVIFTLDNRPVLTKKSPPYNVELDLGDVPRSRVLRVEALDATGTELASDEMMINAGPHRFAVRLEEPRRGKTYNQSLRAQADVVLPEGEVCEKVEFYLNETLVSTLYQPPYVQPIVLPENEFVAYVRAVAYTPDGNSTEHLVFINAPDNLEEIDVDFVELYTTVLDRQKRPVEDLTTADFTVSEEGAVQEVVRFDVVRNLPIHVAILLDVSASMEEELAESQTAALKFLEQAVTPKDRAAVITFNDHPNLVAKFTNDTKLLAGGLAGLKAERGTALYDSLIFTLYYFNGIRGQRAVLVLSDGKDESSRFEFDDALEYARRAGVAIYAVGLKLSRKDGEARRKLIRIADETGGRSFFVENEAELATIYDTIQRELRSRYLLAYQSSNTSGSKRFRSIEVKMGKSGLEAKTLRGYYP